MAEDFSQNAQRRESDDEDDTPNFPQPQQQSTAPIDYVEETDIEEMGNPNPAKRRRSNPFGFSSRKINQSIDVRSAVCVLWNRLLQEAFGISDNGIDHLPLLPAPEFTHPFDRLADVLQAGPLKDKVLLLSTLLAIIIDGERRDQDQKEKEKTDPQTQE
jgi:hypothetical protein